jgi:hypothetical protein
MRHLVRSLLVDECSMEGRDEKRDVLAFQAGVLLSPTCLASTTANNRLFFPPLEACDVQETFKHMRACNGSAALQRCAHI